MNLLFYDTHCILLKWILGETVLTINLEILIMESLVSWVFLLKLSICVKHIEVFIIN